MRPFERTENNLIEIINELIFLTMITIIVPFDDKKDWEGKVKSVYTSIILSNSLIITVIMISKYISKI